MKLITKEIERKLPPLYANEDKPASETPVIFKLFNPYGSGTWYITEGDLKTGVLFGLCVLHEAELGYVDLNELMALKKWGRPQIERDLHFGPCTLADVMKKEGGV